MFIFFILGLTMKQRILVIVTLFLAIIGSTNAKPLLKFVQNGQTGPQNAETDRNFFYPVYTAFRVNGPFVSKDDFREWIARRISRG